MEQNYFSDKNVLYLLPDDGNLYLNFLCDEFQKNLPVLHRFNFVKYSHQNGLRNTEKHIRDLVSDKKIDVIITTHYPTDYQLSVGFYASLKNEAKIVVLMGDEDAYVDVYSKYYCQIADAAITNYYITFIYERLGIPAVYLLPTFSRDMYYPVETARDIDVCFIGGCFQRDRREYIDFLIKNGINIETYGIGSKNGFIEWSRFSGILSRSKIVLNFNKIDTLDWVNKDEPLLNKVRQNGGHYCESALTRSFCLSEYTPCIRTIAEIGKEVAVFYDKDDLLAKIKYYLSNAAARESIAGNAYKRAVREFVPEVTIPKILKELGEVLEKTAGPRPGTGEIFLSRNFKIKTVNGLTFSMFVLLKKGEVLYALEVFGRLFQYGVLIFIPGFFGGLVRAMKNILSKVASRKTVSL